MIHHPTKLKPLSDHWGVSWTGKGIPGVLASRVLVQVQEDGNQARIALTPDEAEDMATALLIYAARVRKDAADPASISSGTDSHEAQTA